MKFFVFGVGQYYQNRKKQFFDISSDDTFLGFLDNSAHKGKKMDGFPVFSPSVVSNMQFDRIVLMSTYYQEIIEQLKEFGVSRDKIIYWEEYRAEKTHGIINFQMVKSQVHRKSVLIISTDMNYNGGSIAAVYAAIALTKIGYNVCLAVPSCDAIFRKEKLMNQINLLVCPSLPYISNWEKSGIEQVDIVLVNVFQMVKVACDISQYKPVLWWIHESDGTPDAVYGQTRYQFSEYDNINAMRKIGIYAVSDIARQAFERYYPHQVAAILPYGISDEADQTAFHFSQSGKFVFAIIGTVSQLKSQTVFLEAASMLNEEVQNDCEFWVIGACGQDAYGKKVQEMAADIPNVKLLGVMNRNELRKAFREITCVVCASLVETMSLTITEGMMHGKICITTDRTGIAEYIEDGINGFICKAGDVSSLHDCMRKAFDMREKSKALRENGRILYEKEFSMDRFAERIDHALQNTIKRYHKDPCPDKNGGWQ